MSLFEVHNISLDVPDMNHHVVFGQRRKLRILKNISMQIERGETLGIVGESGSGKTSLGRTLLRLYEPSEGKLIYGGQDISHFSQTALKPLRRRMQMIFQDPQSSLNPRKTIGNILASAMRLHEVSADEKDVNEVLDRVGLPATTRSRYPHQLSGGQRQRVGIARAIALKPEFVVADEIVSGLDASTQARVLELLKGLRDEMGLALAFISHDLSVIRHICDRVVILKSGEIVEAGRTADTFRVPKSTFTKQLIGAIPLPEPDPEWLKS
jgi:ABC-type glutathione transport system ATPase component